MSAAAGRVLEALALSEVAVVVGAAGGIGAGVAEHLLERRPIAPLRRRRSRARAGRTRSSSGSAPTACSSDRSTSAITPPSSDCVDDLAGRLGDPTQLVYSAGVQHNESALELAYEDWCRVLEVNLYGAFSFCQAVGRRMVAAGRGSIVVVSSISLYFGFPRRLPYIVSKNGLVGLVQTLAVEWAPEAFGSTASHLASSRRR